MMHGARNPARRYSAFFAALVLLLAPLQAAAFALEKCNRMVSEIGYGHELAYRDLGKGVVSWVTQADINGDAMRWHHVMACGTGRIVSAMAACEETEAGFCDNGTRGLDAPDEVGALLHRIVAAPEPHTLDQLRDKLASVALDTRDYMLDDENCGCRAAYPNMRNGKKRFKMERWN